jgi:N-acetylmuramoyl-L-alanine amidase
LTKELEELIAKAGFKPILIRSSDKYVDFEDRTKLAKREKADVYLELHYNSAGPGNTETRGVEVYCLTLAGASSTNGGSDQYGGALAGNRHDEKNVQLAYQVHRSLVLNAGLVDRGVRRARFEVLRNAEMPAILIEGGFMSHPDEMRNIQDTARRRQIAQAILDGLLAYKRLVER